VPHAIRPGDVLAGRYQLIDLLDESGGGLFYRAYDSSLDRSVAVHIIRADDERAGLLREAARTSARVVDRRLLRIRHVSPTSPSTSSSWPSSSTSRSPIRGRRTISSSTPSSFGDCRIPSSPACSSSVVKCLNPLSL